MITPTIVSPQSNDDEMNNSSAEYPMLPCRRYWTVICSYAVRTILHVFLFSYKSIQGKGADVSCKM